VKNSAAEGWQGRAWLVLTPPAMSVLMIAIGWQTTQARGGRPAVEAMILAQIVLLAIVYSSLLPILRRMAKADAANRLKLAMRAGGQRFLLTLVAVAVVIVGGWAERRPFLLWIAIGYVVMTLAETIALTRWLNETENAE
jgi:hypothetical protein